MEPTISVVIPTYNRAFLLKRAINSVLRQTYQNFELIVVDDGSTDDTKQVVQKIQDDRIVYVRHTINGGAARARNTGIKISRGELIAFLDDDDEYHERFLEEMAFAFESSPKAGFGWSGFVFVKEEKGKHIVVRKDLWLPKFRARQEAYWGFLRYGRIGTCGLVVRRQCFDNVGLFDEQCEAAEDTELLLRLAGRYDYIVVPKILVIVHESDRRRLTKNLKKYAVGLARIVQKHQGMIKKDQEMHASLLYKIALLYYYSGNRLKGRLYMIKTLRIRPFWVKVYIIWFILEVFRSVGPNIHKTLGRLRKQRKKLRKNT